jgi:hypothetical protein
MCGLLMIYAIKIGIILWNDGKLLFIQMIELCHIEYGYNNTSNRIRK